MKSLMMITALTLGLGTAVLAEDTMPMMPQAKIADLTLTGGYAHATLPNQPVAGGFVTIANTGQTDDRLIAAASPTAGVMQIHTMAMDGDVMVMREVTGGLPIPAEQTVVLQPSGLHLMFMQLTGPLTLGGEVAVTLSFEQAGQVELVLPIRKKMAAGRTHGTGGDS